MPPSGFITTRQSRARDSEFPTTQPFPSLPSYKHSSLFFFLFITMPDQCTICICDYTEPVSIPCGHVYCMQCLSDYITSSSPDGLTALCPTCRADFSIVVPELHSFSKQFHRYITPSIRRVFIEPNPSESYEELKQKFKVSEARSATLKRENLDLQISCRKHTADAMVHARGERAAKSEVEKLGRQLEMEKTKMKGHITHLRRILDGERIKTWLALFFISISIFILLLFFGFIYILLYGYPTR
ncbi:hypothetical protein IW262DRAFT_249324 [Armillaria fumosa]|nr:hypothetical protein IW262DRAFT_249324 [Armillaria fumosa]